MSVEDSPPGHLGPRTAGTGVSITTVVLESSCLNQVLNQRA